MPLIKSAKKEAVGKNITTHKIAWYKHDFN